MRKIRVMIVGIPNVGKSSFINRIAKKTSAEVGNKPGVTKQKQWIRINEKIELLDTPGVLWPKFENEKVAMNLAITGTIKDDILELTEVAYTLTKFMLENYRNNLLQRYSLDEKQINEILNQEQAENENIYEIMPKCSNKSIEEDLKKLILDFNLYPWGESKKQKIPSFYAIHKLKGAVVCKTEIVKGIGMAMGMYCPKIDKVTSDIDTNLKNKRDCALKLIKDYDFVLLHINGADEAGHRKNKKEKEEFIKRIDREVIKFLKEKDFNLIVTSDHGTSCESGKHINGLVNFYMTNKEGEKWLR